MVLRYCDVLGGVKQGEVRLVAVVRTVLAVMLLAVALTGERQVDEGNAPESEILTSQAAKGRYLVFGSRATRRSPAAGVWRHLGRREGWEVLDACAPSPFATVRVSRHPVHETHCSACTPRPAGRVQMDEQR